MNDFDPLVNVGGNAFVLAVNPRRGFGDLTELIEFTKDNPGELNVAHAGVGAFTYLSALMFLEQAGIDATTVPYKGGAAALVDVISGQCDIYSASPSEIMQYVESGDVSLLGISSGERLEQLPKVPTISELYPGYAVETWNGLVGTAGMPDDIKEEIETWAPIIEAANITVS